ncbi:hypothetical protein MUN78_06975 [Leucobacter allii]|uniref:Uncharacterized protein n=1 Tax=Leucobacter allii TaxID=2932247 RepID=A0ABY4FQV2_9MICO|nr:hypothetical protein [Leucobacter allii]UOQ58559.1 hypothetical protein MUN78_06975 [Leucobacter allii]
MITPMDLGGDENIARRVLIRARSIAPCLDSIENGSERWKDAVALLKGVIAELPAPGSRRTRSMGRNGTTMSFEIASAFTNDDVASLRALCTQPDGKLPGLPVGSFPQPGIVDRMWPEGPYT